MEGLESQKSSVINGSGTTRIVHSFSEKEEARKSQANLSREPATQTKTANSKNIPFVSNQGNNQSVKKVVQLVHCDIAMENKDFDESLGDESDDTTTTETSNGGVARKMQADKAGLVLKNSTSMHRKKTKELSQSQPLTVETQLLSDIANTSSQSDKDAIHKQCQDLLAKISDEERVLPMEEVLQIVQDWKPKQEILCLYVRIARKLPANFHLDSILTLLCISKQCGYTPIQFLTKTKSLQITPSKSLQITPSSGRYNFSFMFKTISNKTLDGDTLDRKFVGLSLTLTLLEHTVSNSCGVISRDGMRSTTPREPVSKALDLGGTTNMCYKTMPSNEFHKRTSLINRLWLALNH